MEVILEEVEQIDTNIESVKDEIETFEEKGVSEEEKIEQSDFSPYRLEEKYENSVYILEVPIDDWHCKIYQVRDVKSEVFDLEKDDIGDQMQFQKAPNRMYISDEDGDNLEEIYLFFEDELTSSWMLILNKSLTPRDGENKFNSVYYGLSEDVPKYANIDDKDRLELLTNHSGGGGVVSVWDGLKLANVFRKDTNTYVYSYIMTKKYYEDAQVLAEKNIIENPREESYVDLLKNLAHQGKTSDCERIIKELKKANYTLNSDWEKPYETYYEYILAQSSYYEDIWLQIKEWDMYLEKESKSVKEEIFSSKALNKKDLTLENGLYLNMSYDDFCDKFSYNGTLEFNVGRDGNSTCQAPIIIDKIDLIFEWSPENTSSPLLIEYAVKDQSLKTNKGIGLGMNLSSIIEAYGEADYIGYNTVSYKVEDTQLVFEFIDNRVVRYRIDNGTGLLIEND